MKILHLTDIHSDLDGVERILSKVTADLVVISGDITHFDHHPVVEKTLKLVNLKYTNVVVITGNCDYPDCETYLTEQGISIDSTLSEFNSIQFGGLSGSLPCPGKTPNEFSEDDFSLKLNMISEKTDWNRPMVLVSHQPPYNTLNDKVISGQHVGSHSVREFIESYQPLLCLTGHIHEGKGVGFIGKCPVVNPGPVQNGHYAVIEITGKNPPRINLY